MSMLTMGMGDDGSGLEVAVVTNQVRATVKVKPIEKIAISTEMNRIKIKTSNMGIGVDFKARSIPIAVKE